MREIAPHIRYCQYARRCAGAARRRDFRAAHDPERLFRLITEAKAGHKKMTMGPAEPPSPPPGHRTLPYPAVAYFLPGSLPSRRWRVMPPYPTSTTRPKTRRMGWKTVVDSSGLKASGQLNRGETWLMTNFRPDGWPTVIPRVFTEDVGGVVGFLKLVFRPRRNANGRPG